MLLLLPMPCHLHTNTTEALREIAPRSRRDRTEIEPRCLRRRRREEDSPRPKRGLDQSRGAEYGAGGGGGGGSSSGGGTRWTEYMDEGGQRTYFVSDDGQTTWERPVGGQITIVRSTSVIERDTMLSGIACA